MASPLVAPDISDDELHELLQLLKGADSAELKATVPEGEQHSTVHRLGLDPLDAQIRQIFFFDTPDLQLFEAGLVVRARRIQDEGDDTVVKLRPVDPAALPAGLRESAAFGVEVDAMPHGKHVCSASLKGRTTGVREAVIKGEGFRELFSKEQRRFYADHAPAGLGIDNLSALGPIFVLKLKFKPEILGRRLVAEMWFYPDGTRALELSTKCKPSQAFQVAVEVRSFLADSGIDITGEQQTKTRTALTLFSEALRAEQKP